jgi:hypothetical protein
VNSVVQDGRHAELISTNYKNEKKHKTALASVGIAPANAILNPELHKYK